MAEKYPKQKLATDLVTMCVDYAREHDRVVAGQTIIHEHGPDALLVQFRAWPNGNYACWFQQDDGFAVVSLVNETGAQSVDVFTPQQHEEMSERWQALMVELE